MRMMRPKKKFHGDNDETLCKEPVGAICAVTVSALIYTAAASVIRKAQHSAVGLIHGATWCYETLSSVQCSSVELCVSSTEYFFIMSSMKEKYPFPSVSFWSLVSGVIRKSPQCSAEEWCVELCEEERILFHHALHRPSSSSS